MQELPKEIPLFPLQKCILLPGCNLPLQLFEPRYLQMYEDLQIGAKFIGIIQPKSEVEPTHIDLFDVGTVAEIIEAKSLPNRRYAVVLRGLRRFCIQSEITDKKVLYRKATVSYEKYIMDPSQKDVHLDRDEFFVLLDQYIRKKKIKIKMENIKSIRNFQLINILSQVLPFSVLEKQALLEVESHHDRMEQLITLLKMETYTSGQISENKSDPILN
ncbi:MAG: LON peptidase substrate-binding domain-containing protein [Deltaproteobacteria bacterium]|nr:LON peptidase substrate-binding domain-containing protein [Deltaproteobacteria bacterium]